MWESPRAFISPWAPSPDALPIVVVPSGPGQTKPLYRCEVCGRAASYGFGCLPGNGKTGAENGKWYCASLAGGPACKATGQVVPVHIQPPEPLLPVIDVAPKLL